MKVMAERFWRRAAAGAAMVVAALGVGCGKPAGVIFPPVNPPLTWPQGDVMPRMRYVGQLTGSADLKPAVSGLEAVGRAMFGRKATYTMLSPYAVCTDGADRVFVADSQAQLVHVFDLRTRKYARWKPAKPRRFTQPVGLAYDRGAGRLYVSDSVGGTVFIFDSAGKTLGETLPNLFTRPTGVCFDAAANRLLVTDTAAHSLVVLAPNGEPITQVGGRGTEPGQFNYPTNVAVDGLGRVYVCDSLNFRVQQFGPDLKPLRVIAQKGDMPGYLSTPKGVAADADNHLYVVDANFEAVQVFSSEGALLMDFGQEGHRPGEFWLPAGICIDRGNRVWVADTYNRRVQVFEYLPEVRQP